MSLSDREKDESSAFPATLVVADADLAAELAQAGQGRIVALDHYLDALGEMSRGPIHAVIGPLDPMAQTLEATARALRRLSPDARLLLLVQPDQEPLALRAVRCGFSDYLLLPISPDRLLHDLFGGPSAVEPEPPPSPTAPDQPGPDGPATPVTDQPLEFADAQLAEHLRCEGRGVLGPALMLARNRTGAELRHDAQAGPGAIPIQSGGRTFGYLTAPELDAHRLTQVAQWLASWLALEHHLTTLKTQAQRDELTGLWNLRYFRSALDTILDTARRQRFRVTLMIYDIDDFKDYNDRYGHQAGDDILRETASLMQSVVRKQDVVARIGGDEFAVIFWDAEPPRQPHSHHPQSVREVAQRFQRAIEGHQFPKLAGQAPGSLTISGGLAGYPWDGRTADELIDLADRMLRESKAQGKNALTFGPGAMRS